MKHTFYFVKSALIAFIVLLFVNSSSAQWGVGTPVHIRSFNGVKILNYNQVVAVGGNLVNDSLRAVYTSQDTGKNYGDTWGYIRPWITAVSFPTAHSGYMVGFSGGLFKSTDMGNNWDSLPLAPGSAGTRNYNAVCFIDSMTGYVVGGNESNDSIRTILKTIDGGQSWSVQMDNPGYWLKSVWFVDADTGYAVGAMGTILKTTDGGNNWNTITLTGNVAGRRFNAVRFVSNTKGYIVGGNPTNDSITTILQTTDAGATWNILLDNLGSMLNAITFVDNQRGYAVGDRGLIMKTDDGGDNWVPESVSLSINDNSRSLMAVDFLNRGFGVAVGEGGKMLRYWAPDSISSGVPVIPAATFTLQVYPNPATNMATVSLSKNLHGTIALYNSTGMLVSRQAISGIDNILPLQNLPEGVYLVKTETEQGTAISKLVIQ